MMRGMTILWTGFALVVGVGLFLLKYEVQSLEDRLAGLNGGIRQNQETIHILKAEWSYLNDPERLRELNERHLALKPFKPEQIVAIAELPMAAPKTEPQPDGEPAAPAVEPPAGRLLVDAPAAPKKPAAAKPAELRDAKAKAPAPAPVAPKQLANAVPAPVLRPVERPQRVASAPVMASAPGNVLVIKSPALLDAERRAGR